MATVDKGADPARVNTVVNVDIITCYGAVLYTSIQLDIPTGYLRCHKHEGRMSFFSEIFIFHQLPNISPKYFLRALQLRNEISFCIILQIFNLRIEY